MKKICAGCGRNRKYGKFARDSYRTDGKRIYCRDCISILNRRYRNSPIGRIKHRKSVEKWRTTHKTAIKKYNQEYYRKKRRIILYNKRARLDTIPMFPIESGQHLPITETDKRNSVHITINPKKKIRIKVF